MGYQHTQKNTQVERIWKVYLLFDQTWYTVLEEVLILYFWLCKDQAVFFRKKDVITCIHNISCCYLFWYLVYKKIKREQTKFLTSHCQQKVIVNVIFNNYYSKKFPLQFLVFKLTKNAGNIERWSTRNIINISLTVIRFIVYIRGYKLKRNGGFSTKTFVHQRHQLWDLYT